MGSSFFVHVDALKNRNTIEKHIGPAIYSKTSVYFSIVIFPIFIGKILHPLVIEGEVIFVQIPLKTKGSSCCHR